MQPLLTNLFGVFALPDSQENEYAMKAVMRTIGFLGAAVQVDVDNHVESVSGFSACYPAHSHSTHIVGSVLHCAHSDQVTVPRFRSDAGEWQLFSAGAGVCDWVHIAKLKCDSLRTNSAFNFNVRPYTLGPG